MCIYIYIYICIVVNLNHIILGCCIVVYDVILHHYEETSAQAREREREIDR